MKYSHRDGLEETVIATVMRDVLCALKYIHQQGGIHRDVKVGTSWSHGQGGDIMESWAGEVTLRMENGERG